MVLQKQVDTPQFDGVLLHAILNPLYVYTSMDANLLLLYELFYPSVALPIYYSKLYLLMQ